MERQAGGRPSARRSTVEQQADRTDGRASDRPWSGKPLRRSAARRSAVEQQAAWRTAARTIGPGATSRRVSRAGEAIGRGVTNLRAAAKRGDRAVASPKTAGRPRGGDAAVERQAAGARGRAAAASRGATSRPAQRRRPPSSPKPPRPTAQAPRRRATGLVNSDVDASRADEAAAGPVGRRSQRAHRRVRARDSRDSTPSATSASDGASSTAPATRRPRRTSRNTSPSSTSTISPACRHTSGILRTTSSARGSVSRCVRRWCTTSRWEGSRTYALAGSFSPSSRITRFNTPGSSRAAVGINLREDVEAFGDGLHDADPEALSRRRQLVLPVAPDQDRARLRVDRDVEAVFRTIVDDDVERERGRDATARSLHDVHARQS